jgi:hypothetical protein
MRKGLRVPLLAVTLALAAGQSSAQLPPQTLPAAQQQPPNRLQLERRVQQAFAQRVRNELGLNAQQATQLGEATLGFQNERQNLIRRENELRRRYRMEAGGGGRAAAAAMPDAQAIEILNELKALRAAELDLYTREQARLLQVLTPGQVVRYYLLREQLADRINGLRGEAPGPNARGAAPAGRGRAGPPPGARRAGAPPPPPV